MMVIGWPLTEHPSWPGVILRHPASVFPFFRAFRNSQFKGGSNTPHKRSHLFSPLVPTDPLGLKIISVSFLIQNNTKPKLTEFSSQLAFTDPPLLVQGLSQLGDLSSILSSFFSISPGTQGPEDAFLLPAVPTDIVAIIWAFSPPPPLVQFPALFILGSSDSTQM